AGYQLGTSDPSKLDEATKPKGTDGLFLLLPFLLGFSTPLVLSILNRWIESIQTFFGISLAGATARPGTGDGGGSGGGTGRGGGVDRRGPGGGAADTTAGAQGADTLSGAAGGGEDTASAGGKDTPRGG